MGGSIAAQAGLFEHSGNEKIHAFDCDTVTGLSLDNSKGFATNYSDSEFRHEIGPSRADACVHVFHEVFDLSFIPGCFSVAHTRKARGFRSRADRGVGGLESDFDALDAAIGQHAGMKSVTRAEAVNANFPPEFG